jgi:Flp pilus assembly protein TadD
VTSYLSPYPHDPSQRRLLISGEISRIQPGEGTLKVLVSDTEGKKIASGDMPLAAAGGATRSFSTNIAVPQGSYIVRLGVIDSAGRVGSVDHRADVRDVPLGPLSATGPVLVRVPRSQDGEPRLLLDGAHQSERLALEVDLEGDRGRLETTAVEFEIAARVDGPVLLRTPAALSPGPRSNSMIAQAIADMRVLPPGNYVVRAKVSTGTESLGDLRRVFAVTEAPRMVMAENAPAAAVAPEAIARPSGRWMVPPAPFHVSQVLSPPVLGAFLERVGARPDVSSPALRELLDRARTRGLEGLPVDEVAATAGPVGPFLKGLTLLADNKLEAAAAAFRDAMRASSDFYPAMVYLGACYAAGGKDKEAAAAWRTALIREGDAPALHLLLADAQLRQGRGDLAAEDLEAARARWPEDEGLKRRYAVAAMQAGDQVGGLQALEELVERRAEDEPSLALGLLVLYEAIGSGQPIESADRDRARLLRFADAYRARGGPALALVDTWVAAVTAKE